MVPVAARETAVFAVAEVEVLFTVHVESRLLERMVRGSISVTLEFRRRSCVVVEDVDRKLARFGG